MEEGSVDVVYLINVIVIIIVIVVVICIISSNVVISIEVLCFFSPIFFSK